jgi:hypothetical protein
MPDPCRPEFLTRLDERVKSFKKDVVPLTWIPIQLMNEFVSWNENEEKAVADRVGMPLGHVQSAYTRLQDLRFRDREDENIRVKRALKRDKHFNDFVNNATSSNWPNESADARTQKLIDDMLKGAFAQTGNTGFGFPSKHQGKPWATAPAYLQDYCATLELKWPCTRDEAQAAFRTKVKKHHPDVGGDAKTFQTVQAAWDALNQYFEVRK